MLLEEVVLWVDLEVLAVLAVRLVLENEQIFRRGSDMDRIVDHQGRRVNVLQWWRRDRS